MQLYYKDDDEIIGKNLEEGVFEDSGVPYNFDNERKTLKENLTSPDPLKLGKNEDIHYENFRIDLENYLNGVPETRLIAPFTELIDQYLRDLYVLAPGDEEGRGRLLQNLREDFIRIGRNYGLSEYRIIRMFQIIFERLRNFFSSSRGQPDGSETEREVRGPNTLFAETERTVEPIVETPVVPERPVEPIVETPVVPEHPAEVPPAGTERSAEPIEETPASTEHTVEAPPVVPERSAEPIEETPVVPEHPAEAPPAGTERPAEPIVETPVVPEHPAEVPPAGTERSAEPIEETPASTEHTVEAPPVVPERLTETTAEPPVVPERPAETTAERPEVFPGLNLRKVVQTSKPSSASEGPPGTIQGLNAAMAARRGAAATINNDPVTTLVIKNFLEAEGVSIPVEEAIKKIGKKVDDQKTFGRSVEINNEDKFLHFLKECLNQGMFEKQDTKDDEETKTKETIEQVKNRAKLEKNKKILEAFGDNNQARKLALYMEEDYYELVYFLYQNDPGFDDLIKRIENGKNFERRHINVILNQEERAVKAYNKLLSDNERIPKDFKASVFEIIKVINYSLPAVKSFSDGLKKSDNPKEFISNVLKSPFEVLGVDGRKTASFLDLIKDPSIKLKKVDPPKVDKKPKEIFEKFTVSVEQLDKPDKPSNEADNKEYFEKLEKYKKQKFEKNPHEKLKELLDKEKISNETFESIKDKGEKEIINFLVDRIIAKEAVELEQEGATQLTKFSKPEEIKNAAKKAKKKAEGLTW